MSLPSNIDIGKVRWHLWNQLGQLVLDCKLDHATPDLHTQTLFIRFEQAKLIVYMLSYKWDICHFSLYPTSKV